MPPFTIDPTRFTDKPFMAKRTWPDSENDYRVMINGLTAGRIVVETHGGAPVWLWSITGPYIPAELQPCHGREDTLEQAQEEFKAKFWQWHRWAQDQDGGACWMVEN